MAKKRGRANGEGSIYQRKDGRWVGATKLTDGKRKYVYGRTRKEAGNKLRDLHTQLAAGLPIGPERITLERYAPQWLDARKASVKASTWIRYEQLLRIQVVPNLGKKRLRRISPEDLERLYGQLIDSGLAEQTVLHVHRALNLLFKSALRTGLVGRNVAELAEPPRVKRSDIPVLDTSEVRMLLDAAQGTRLYAAWYLAAATGIRPGELLALRWRDLNLDARLLHVRRTIRFFAGGFALEEPKTKSSLRTFSITEEVAKALREHRLLQNQERLLAGPHWADNDLVFAMPDGRPIREGEFGRQYLRPILKKASLPISLTPYVLRHSAISIALAKGVAPTDVSLMAGHSSVAVTLSRYAHALPGASVRATDAIHAAVFNA